MGPDARLDKRLIARSAAIATGAIGDRGITIADRKPSRCNCLSEIIVCTMTPALGSTLPLV